MQEIVIGTQGDMLIKAVCHEKTMKVRLRETGDTNDSCLDGLQCEPSSCAVRWASQDFQQPVPSPLPISLHSINIRPPHPLKPNIWRISGGRAQGLGCRVEGRVPPRRPGRGEGHGGV